MANEQIDQPNPPDQPQSLPPDSDLLRMLRKKAWLEPEGLPDAFLLRPSEPGKPAETGLSVCFACTPDHCMSISGLRLTHGAASLKVRSVTALDDLRVVPDSANHAEIRGLPNKEVEADRAKAEFLASQLAKAVTAVDRTRREA